MIIELLLQLLSDSHTGYTDRKLYLKKKTRPDRSLTLKGNVNVDYTPSICTLIFVIPPNQSERPNHPPSLYPLGVLDSRMLPRALNI